MKKLPFEPLASSATQTSWDPDALSNRRDVRVEWPTIAVAAGCYGLWGIAILLASGIILDVPVWIWAPIAAVAAAWQASLQHEVIHGHPTSSGWVNRLVAGPPLVLWLPFECYRRSHLAHHRDERLTDPLDDPESYYVTQRTWQGLGGAHRSVLYVLNTLLGRLILGPWFAFSRCFWTEVRGLFSVDNVERRQQIRALVAHLFQAGLVALTLDASGVDFSVYVLAVAWPATSLMLVRSFIEHRPAHDPSQRTAIVEDRGFWSLLFLSNNLHALHHQQPWLPWYRLEPVYRANRRDILARNGFYWFPGYMCIFRKFALKPKDSPRHPHL